MHERINEALWRVWCRIQARDDRGQSTVEYAIVTSAIAVAALAAVGVLEGGLKGAFEALIAKLPGGGGGGGGGGGN
jgi:Flp pilus assembly pilin Flp